MAPPSEAALTVLEACLRDVFSSCMTLIDEEDAVLLYRCTRIAESSPLLLESCEMRRTTLEQAFADRLDQLWQSTRPRLVNAVEGGGPRLTSDADRQKLADYEGQLENSRIASKVRQQHHEVAKDAAVKSAIRKRAEEGALLVR